MSVTSTIKSAGGDYTTLSAWEDAKDGLGVDTYIADCYSGFNLGTVYLLGWTNDSVIVIQGASGNRHNGDKTAGAYITLTHGGAGIEVGTSNVVTIDGIRFDGSGLTASGNYAYGVLAPAAQMWLLTVKNCLMHFPPSPHATSDFYGMNIYSNSVGNEINIYNNLVLYASCGILVFIGTYGAVTTLKVQNNTIDGGGVTHATASTGIQIYKGQYSAETIDATVKNNISIRTTDKDFYSIAGVVFTANDNCSEDATGDDFGATGSLVNQTPSDLFVTLGSDYTPKAASNILDTGADLSGEFTTDIAGNTRPASNWDMGAVEYVVAASFNMKRASMIMAAV